MLEKQKLNFKINSFILKAIGLFLLVIILILFSRGKTIEDQYPGKIVLRSDFELSAPEVYQAWKAMVESFQEKHPNVVIVRMDEVTKKLVIAQAANKIPDIVTPNTFSLYRYRHNFLALDDLIKRDSLELRPDDFYPILFNSGRYLGKQVIIPYAYNVSLLYYNVDMFREAKVPFPNENWTYQDYVDATKKLAKFDEDGKEIQWGTAIIPHWWVEWLTHVQKSGGEFFAEDWQRCLMDTPESIAGLGFFNDLVNTYKVSPEPRNLDNFPFLNQQAAMEFCGHIFNWIGLRHNAKFEWDVTLLPESLIGPTGGECVAVGMGINKQSKHKEMAWEFIKHVMRFENMTRLIDAGLAPVRKSVSEQVFLKRGADGKYLVGPQHKEIVLEALKYTKNQSNLPEFMVLAQNHALPYIQSMLRQEITPEECGKIITNEVNNFLKLIHRFNPEWDYERGCLKTFE